jgi:hypothetical protein
LLADWHNRSDTLFARMSEAAAALLGESAATIPVVHEGEIVGHIRLRGSGQMLLGFLIACAAGIAGCQALLVLGALYLSRRIFFSKKNFFSSAYNGGILYQRVLRPTLRSTVRRYRRVDEVHQTGAPVGPKLVDFVHPTRACRSSSTRVGINGG